MEAIKFQEQKGCNCASCIEKAKRNYAYFEKHQDRADEVFFDYALKGQFEQTSHQNKRNFQRGMNLGKAKNLIQDGFPISISESKFAQEVQLTILTHDHVKYMEYNKITHKKEEKSKYIPFHFVISYSFVTNTTTLISFYRPNHEKWSWKWDETYQYQIYNHSKEEELHYEKFVKKNWEVL